MLKVTLGQTGITVNKNGFGALPIQRVTKEEAAQLLCKAYDQGFQYFDTARDYTDSEEKLGYALHGVRSHLYLATKTHAKDTKKFWADLETSLKLLQTDYIDVYQFHNPAFVPKPGGADGLYEAALKAKEQGKIRHIGITNHRMPVALEAVASGLYATMQYPFSYLANEEELALVEKTHQAGMGFIAMKGMAGGLLPDGRVSYAFMSQFDHVLPIWGIQRDRELEEFLSCQANPPVLDETMQAVIAKNKKELVGGFCRSCGYCLPCPVGIDIPQAARMSLLLRRFPTHLNLTPARQANMALIPKCLHCNHCKNNCPYGLDTPELLKENYKDYLTFLK